MDNKEKRTGKPTMALSAYKEELYSKEAKKMQRKFSDKMGSFEQLFEEANIEVVKEQLEIMQKLFGEYEVVTHKHCNVAGEEFKESIMNTLDQKREEFKKFETRCEQWLNQANTDGEQGISSPSQDIECEVAQEKNEPTEIDGTSTMQLTYNLMRSQIKAEEQLSLFADIAKSKDTQLMERERRKLVEVNNEMEEISSKLTNHLSDEDKLKVLNITEKVNTQVKAITSKIAAETAKIDDQSSQKSHTSKRSRKSLRSTLLDGMMRDISQNHHLDSSYSGSKKGLAIKPHSVNRDSNMVNMIRRLRNQEEMIKEVLATSNSELMKKEMCHLNELCNEAEDLADPGNSELLAEHDEIRGKIEETKQLVVKWMVAQCEKDRRSRGSSGRSSSRKSKCSSGKKSGSQVYVRDEMKEWKSFEQQLIRLKGQRKLVESILSTEDPDMMNRELDLLEKMYQNLTISTKELSTDFLSGKGFDAEKELIEEEKLYFDLKKQAVKWFVRLEEAETFSQSSKTSRHSFLSSTSACSKNKDSVRKSEEEHREELSNEISSLLKTLQVKKEMCYGYFEAENKNALSEEIGKLEEVYISATNAAHRLHEVMNLDEAEEIMKVIQSEDSQILLLKQKAAKLFVEEGDKINVADAETIAKNVNAHCSLFPWKKDDITNEDHLKDEMRNLGSRLEKQKGLINDLLKSKDTELMNCEVQALDRVYDELIANATSLRQYLSADEAKKVSNMIDMEDASVFQLKKSVSRWFSVQVEGVKVHQRSSQPNKSAENDEQRSQKEELIALKADIEILKQRAALTNDAHTESEEHRKYSHPNKSADRKQQSEKDELNSLKADVEQLKKQKVISDGDHADKEECQESSKPENFTKGDPTTANLVKLNEIMVQTLKLQAAPNVEIDKFSGDPLEYNYFIENFKDAVENLIDDPKQRLMRLLKFTEGEAKELIKHCIHEEARSGYDTALNLLGREYGSPLRIASAYLEKLKVWPQLKSNDAVGLRELYRFLLRCESYQRQGVIMDLNSPLTIRTIQLVLPTHLQDKWTGRAGKIRKKKSTEAVFADFLEFVEEESQMLNDPIYARSAAKGSRSGEGRFKGFATEVSKEESSEENLQKEKKNVVKYKEEKVDVKEMVCALCEKNHDLDECEDFMKKAPREKKLFLFRSKMCFSCYGLSHIAKECKNKRLCNICGKEHPTALHEVVFKVSTVSNEEEDGMMCIVPVRLCHKDSAEEIDVYAMLDECSTGCFVDESVVEKLGAKRKTTISLGTIIGDKRVDAYAMDGLFIKGDKESKFASGKAMLPTTYTREKIPMDMEDIPTRKKVERWDYLKNIIADLPELRDIPLGLLIGRNCPKALEPTRFINSQGDGPYAKQTRFGWCVIGPDRSKDSPVGVKCNNIRVSKNSGPSSHIIPNTRITDNAIADALQEMWKADFVETKAERKAMSREDEAFLTVMREHVKIVQGHYELPLPLRHEEATSRTKQLETPECKGKAESKILSNNSNPEENLKSDILKPQIFPTQEELETSNRLHEGISVVMPENRRQAVQRIGYVKRRMKKDPLYKEEYVSSMKKLFAQGYARKVPPERKKDQAWYLFHHGVRHPQKGKFRVVMDCSAEKDGISLNSKLMQGPDFSNSLIGVLLRFRKGLIPFMADIEAMYYQVKVPEQHRRFLRFLWWENDNCDDDLMDCEMCVHPFGAISSKNCVNFALHQTAYDNCTSMGEDAMTTLLKEFYVDDLLKSLDNTEETIDLIRRVVQMCAAGGFNLTKFVCPNEQVMESIPQEKRAEGMKDQEVWCQATTESALGVLWQVQNDSMGFRVNLQPDNGTRRGCLSTISKIHDPLGIGGPFLLKGKKILQRMTTSSLSWDESITGDIAKKWNEWKQEIMMLNDLTFPRCYKSREFGKTCNATLHCFADASFIGYGAAIYLRLVDEKGTVNVSLVLGKSRVSPLKPTTVPRLELVAAVLLVKLAALLLEELQFEGLEAFYWTDNKIVLGYIQNQRRRYRIFVANRVRVIEEYTGGVNWGYVETSDNPADYASRGISMKDSEKVKKWLYGPEFLQTQDEGWRTHRSEGEVLNDDVEVKVEKRVNKVSCSVPESVVEFLERRISSWLKMKRVLAWVRRFISCCRKMPHSQEGSPAVETTVQVPSREGTQVLTVRDLSVQELDSAQSGILKFIQQRDLKEELRQLSKKEVVTFAGEEKASNAIAREPSRESVKQRKNTMKKLGGRLWRLNPFVDKDGLLRVGGRLNALEENESFKFPFIIPRDTIITKRIVEWYHNKIEHRGKHFTICELRQAGLWVVNGSKEVGGVVFKCVRCKWLRGRCCEQMMANLPAIRITAEPPFTYCGADYFGPLLVKEGRKTLKRYGVLFTCLSLRAVHIEVASSLEADSLIQALRRFIARRGAVREIRSDNGTNFVGADNEFQKLVNNINDAKIAGFLTAHNCDWIRWKRNTPTASHMGGAWERQIRTVREILTSMIMSSPKALDEETLTTFLTEAEAIVNSRPLTIENLHDPNSIPLSPMNLLTMKSQFVLPPPGVFQKEDMYCRKRWRMTQHLANCFWSRWRKEYLQLLQPRSKWVSESRNLKVDDVVLLKEDGVMRGHWPMGRVAEVHPSEDGLVRSVTLQTKNSVLKRPVNKTVLLVPTDEGRIES